MTYPRIIAIDFDNTLFATEYPKILYPIGRVIWAAKAERRKGNKLILWTCRQGNELLSAVIACRNVGLIFDAVNGNLPEAIKRWGNDPRKVGADEYWDDRGRSVYDGHLSNSDDGIGR